MKLSKLTQSFPRLENPNYVKRMKYTNILWINCFQPFLGKFGQKNKNMFKMKYGT